MTRRINHFMMGRVLAVLEALGTETLATDGILARLTGWSPNRRELSWFIKNYMMNSYVSRTRNYKGSDKIVKYRAIAR